MFQNYYEVVKALEELAKVVNTQADRFYVLLVLILIVLLFNVFRRKEHI